jgi:hypothetical protein
MKPKVLKLGAISQDNSFNSLNLNNYEDLENSLLNLDFSKEGYMLYSMDRKYRTKLKGDGHKKVLKLKGNHPNIVYRILEIRSNKDVLKEFIDYYPEYLIKIEETELNIDKLSKKVLNLYTVVKKIKPSNEIDIPKLYKKIIYDLHQEYKKLMDKYDPNVHTYKPNINLRKVIHYLNNDIDTTYLYLLLKDISSN